MTHPKKVDVSLSLNIDWNVLATLSAMVRYDPASQSLCIQNGDARLILKKDGTVRAEGKRLVHVATEDISLNAAWIDLN